MRSKTLILLSFCVLLLSSCEKDGACTEQYQIVPTENLVSPEPLKLNIDSTNKDVGIVIRSKSDYEKYVSSNAILPEIDFSKSFLIAARVSLTTCGAPKEHSLTLACNELSFNTTTQSMTCQSPTEVYFFALVDNKYIDKAIKFNQKRI